MAKRASWLLILILALAAGAGGFFLWKAREARDPKTIVATTLEAVRAQNRLTVFAARSVAVVTSTQTRFGLQAQKTLILPGTVRYEIDFAKLSERNLDWDAAQSVLTITLPALELAGPEIDYGAVREYASGTVMLALTDAESVIDAANRQAAQADLLKQARNPMLTRLAEAAAVKAVQTTFTLPLTATGTPARVVARFADPR